MDGAPVTGAGPQKYPGASLTAWYQDTYGGDAMEVNVVVLHTTEGRTLPGYGGGGSAPNLTAVPDLAAKKLRWFQHFDIDTSSRALVNRPGGVATNTLNVTQVELVGTCDPVTHAKWAAAGQAHIFWPEAPEWALAELAVFLRWMNAQHGVPPVGPKSWPAYPSSYGATDARFTFAEWNAFAGVCGHMHVPENDHGDPGALDFTRLLALAKGTTTPPKEDDVALTDSEIDRIAVAVLTRDEKILIPGAPTTNPTYTLASTQTEILKRIDRATTTIDKVAAADVAQTAAITALAKLVGSGADTATIVAAVRAEIQTQIAEAVIKVDVAVTGQEN
jgi:hypothetical protein